VSDNGKAIKPRQAYIVSHTHWDREWYLPYHQFRVNLVSIVKRILAALEDEGNDENPYRHFVLDGQAVLLEDYLEVSPDDRGRIKRLVETGKLSLGPWYILPDEFLVSGEATVRNLLIGHQVCSEFGGVQHVGYMPDSFGHMAQIPQLLRKSGIDSFIYTRGNGEELEKLGHEYIWEAPDGSDVLAINQCGGYCNAAGLGVAEIWEAHTNRAVELDRAVNRIGELFAEMSRLSNGDIYLINNGCDHFPPQRDFSQILKALGEAYPEVEFIHTGFSEFVDAVRAAGFAGKRYQGELLGGKYHLILSGVWSSRMYLKQANEYAQTLLEKYVEPIAAFAHFRLGQPYPTGLINYAWKLLLKNHPHDSICGCSTDAVHSEMETRFEGVIQTGEQMLRRIMESLTPNFARAVSDDDQAVVTAFNPSPFSRHEIIERLVVLQPGSRIEALQLQTDTGEAVPVEILDVKHIERFWGVDYRAELGAGAQYAQYDNYLEHFGSRIVKDAEKGDEFDQFVLLQFAAQLPALSQRHFYLRPTADTPEAPVTGCVEVVENRMRNEFCEVTLYGDGSFDLLDLKTNERYDGLNRLEDREDAGDEYDYSPCAQSQVIRSDPSDGSVNLLENTGFSARLAAVFDMALPESLEADRQRRSDERIDCRCITAVRLVDGSPLVEVEMTIANEARDHRLQALFPVMADSESMISEGQFYLNQRPLRQAGGEDWSQPPTGTYPQQGFSAVGDGNRGLVVFNRGLPEVAPLNDESGATGIALTLLRSVGWLSRDDLSSRNNTNAGPTLYTPDAQCPGERSCQYGVMPYRGDLIESGAVDRSEQFHTPILSKQGVADLHVPPVTGLVERTTKKTSITAIKKHESRDTLLVRLYNLTANKVDETLVLGMEASGAWRTNLLEEREGVLPLGEPHRLTVGLEPYEIVTVEITFSGSGTD
jgi:2-O-(6-phospho-alpha-D-mannosyl)-D-glycerate hydrolase